MEKRGGQLSESEDLEQDGEKDEEEDDFEEQHERSDSYPTLGHADNDSYELQGFEGESCTLDAGSWEVGDDGQYSDGSSEGSSSSSSGGGSSSNSSHRKSVALQVQHLLSRPSHVGPEQRKHLGEEVCSMLRRLSDVGPIHMESKRHNLRVLVRLLQNNDLVQEAGVDILGIASGSCALLECAALSSLSSCVQRDTGLPGDMLYFVLTGEADWLDAAGKLLGHARPCDVFAMDRHSGSDSPLSEEGPIFGAPSGTVSWRTKVPVSLAAFPCTPQLRARLENATQRNHEFEAAISAAYVKEPFRSSAEVRAIEEYLVQHETFQALPSDALHAVARQLKVEEFRPGTVICHTGDRPKQLLIVVRGAVSAWRHLPAASADGAECLHPLSTPHVDSLRTTILAAEFVRRKEGMKRGTTCRTTMMREMKKSLRRTSANDVDHDVLTCVGFTGRDQVAHSGEWSLAREGSSAVTLVAHGPVRGKGVFFSLSKGAYLRYVQPYRAEAVLMEGVLSIVAGLPVACRKRGDLHWLQETPLGYSSVLRALPRELRMKVLGKCRHRHVSNTQHLFEEGSDMDTAYLLLRGHLVLCIEEIAGKVCKSINAKRATLCKFLARESRTLCVGDVFGEWAIAEGTQREQWARASVADGDCDLMEIHRSDVEEATRAFFHDEAINVTQRVPLQVIGQVLEILRGTSPEHRSLQQLKSLSSLLVCYRDFADLDSQMCLEVSQSLYIWNLEEGEALPCEATSKAFLAVLFGEVGIFAQRALDDEIRILTVPRWGTVRELPIGVEEDGDDRVVRALKPSALLCLNQESFMQAFRRLSHGSADRIRALHTLKHTEPEERSEDDIDALEKLLTGSDFFGSLDENVRRQACKSMTWQQFPPATPIIRQGDEAEQCFVLLKGVVSIWITAVDDANGIAAGFAGGGTRAGPAVTPGASAPESIQEEASAHSQSVTAMLRSSSKSSSKRNSLKKVAGATRGSQLTVPTAHQSPKKVTTAQNHQEHQGNAHQGGAFITEVAGQAAEDVSPKRGGLGSIEVDLQTGGPMGGRMVKVLEEGACFGEAGLLHSEKRNATIMSREQVECGVIQKEVFNHILRDHFLKEEQRLVEFLHKHLPRPQSGADYSTKVARFFARHRASRGTELCRVGRPCSKFYIIRDGYCKVFRRREGCPDQELGECGIGQAVGVSTSMLGKAGEPFRVICSSACVELLCIELSELKVRLPTELRKAFTDAEASRVARLEARAQQLWLGVGTRPASAPGNSRRLSSVGRQPEQHGPQVVLDSPFLRHKRDILLRDASRFSWMFKVYSHCNAEDVHTALAQPEKQAGEEAPVEGIANRLMLADGGQGHGGGGGGGIGGSGGSGGDGTTCGQQGSPLLMAKTSSTPRARALHKMMPALPPRPLSLSNSGASPTSARRRKYALQHAKTVTVQSQASQQLPDTPKGRPEAMTWPQTIRPPFQQWGSDLSATGLNAGLEDHFLPIMVHALKATPKLEDSSPRQQDWCLPAEESFAIDEEKPPVQPARRECQDIFDELAALVDTPPPTLRNALLSTPMGAQIQSSLLGGGVDECGGRPAQKHDREEATSPMSPTRHVTSQEDNLRFFQESDESQMSQELSKDYAGEAVASLGPPAHGCEDLQPEVSLPISQTAAGCQFDVVSEDCAERAGVLEERAQDSESLSGVIVDHETTLNPFDAEGRRELRLGVQQLQSNLEGSGSVVHAEGVEDGYEGTGLNYSAVALPPTTKSAAGIVVSSAGGKGSTNHQHSPLQSPKSIRLPGGLRSHLGERPELGRWRRGSSREAGAVGGGTGAERDGEEGNTPRALPMPQRKSTDVTSLLDARSAEERKRAKRTEVLVTAHAQAGAARRIHRPSQGVELAALEAARASRKRELKAMWQSVGR